MTKIFVLVLVALCRFDVSSAAMSVDDMVDVIYQCDQNTRNKKPGPPPCFVGNTETLVLMAKDPSNSLNMMECTKCWTTQGRIKLLKKCITGEM